MGDNTIEQVTAPAAIIEDYFNQYFNAITGDFKPRNATSGALEDAVHSLGSATVNWKNLYANNIYIGGVLFNPDAAGAGTDTNNAIVSGRTRTTSEMPDFLRASGSGANATILATSTALQITANGTSVEISADISITSMTVAPSTNNTCTVNDAALTDQASSKYVGESIDNYLTITSAGTEITDRIGQYCAFKTPDGEYFIAFVESATKLNRAYRGFFFDSSGAPIVRGTLANSDTLTLMSLGWVFMDSNGSTVDVTYTTPVYAADEPGSPATDDYWYDTVNKLWKRYDGADFQTVNRIPIGLVVLDGTNCVASRSFDFTKTYNALNEIICVPFSVTQVYSSGGRSSVSVYGTTYEFLGGPIIWDITADLDTGLTEQSSTTYYLYITEDGDTVISDKKYYDRFADLRGYYHPHNSWRCVGIVENSSGSDFDSVTNPEADAINVQTFSASGTWYKPPRGTIARVRMWGGGGGGGSGNSFQGGGGGGAYNEKWILLSTLTASVAVTIGAGGAAGAAGGNTTFGAFLTAYGGGRGTAGATTGATGGGGGGGQTSAGSNAGAGTGGAGGGPDGGAGGSSSDGGIGIAGGAGGGAGGAFAGGKSFWGGGGGGGGNNGSNNGGGSVFGGGGGGGRGSSGSSTGGASAYGGAGGNNNVAGTAPGGGGGGNAAGADGRVEVYVF